jgi:alanyl-tRNA synthetase
MGGQVGDSGTASANGQTWIITDTQKLGDAFLHYLKGDTAPGQGEELEIAVDVSRRAAIQRHHTVTHLFHWALHEVTSPTSTQKGSYVGPEKLTFDFNCQALSQGQVADIERLVNERILENESVSWAEVPHEAVRDRDDILQFFGEKYGNHVRVVQIGGNEGSLNGYSMELCGGTHARATGELGLFRIIAESAIAAGVRRVEAVAGLVASQQAYADARRISELAEMLNSPIKSIEQKVEQALEQAKKLEKQLKSIQQSRAADTAKELLANAEEADGILFITANLGNADGNFAQSVADALKGQFEGVIVLGAIGEGNVALVASVPESLIGKVQAGAIIQSIAPIVGGKGGGKPGNARGGGKNPNKLDEALAQVPKVIVG